MRVQKMRLDDLVVKKGIAESKSVAQSLIIAGKIYLGEKKLRENNIFAAILL